MFTVRARQDSCLGALNRGRSSKKDVLFILHKSVHKTFFFKYIILSLIVKIFAKTKCREDSKNIHPYISLTIYMYDAINTKKISVKEAIQENEKLNNNFILYKLFDSYYRKKKT